MIELGQMFKTFFGLFRKKKQPESKSAVDLPVKDTKGTVVGRIIIHSNGVFIGTIDSERFRRQIETAVSHGFVDSVTLSADIQQPTPPWMRT